VVVIVGYRFLYINYNPLLLQGLLCSVMRLTLPLRRNYVLRDLNRQQCVVLLRLVAIITLVKKP